MKKVSLLLFVSLILLLAFSSCTKIFEEQLPEPFDPGHYHEFGTEWTIDETLHYHACECGARADYANHSDENVDGFCDGCNNSMPLPGATYTVTVKATDQNGKPFFGNTFVVNHGEDAVFDLIVGVQYTLCLGDDVVIVDTKVEDGCRVYTVKVADVTEDKSVAISTEECTHVWNPATCVTPTYCELCSFIESDPLGHNYESVVTAPTCTEKGYTTNTCLRCEDTYVDSEVTATGHNYGENWTTDLDYHWHECVCGDKKDVAEHSLVLETNDAQHWYECSCGYVVDLADHYYVTNDNESTHWDECACGLKKNFVTHTFEEKLDEENHWLECGCGHKKDVTPHDF